MTIASMLDVAGLQGKTDNAFRAALIEHAAAANLNPDYLAAVMALESAFNPQALNPHTRSHGGLIQFARKYWEPIAARAGRPGVTWDDMMGYSAIGQLPFVIAYYQGTRLRGGSADTPTDYYMATFMPAFVGKPAAFELGRRDSSEVIAGLAKGKIYEQNAGLDTNKDGSITVGDVGRKIENIVAAANTRPRVPVVLVDPSVEPSSPAPDSERGGPMIAAVGLLFFCPSCGKRSEVIGVEALKP